MRENLPVTQTEYLLSEDTVLVSYTDLHGNITHANEAFIDASGYRLDEIIGQPHNILRHPDVPSAVFKDLWQTIQAGKPWRQIVKNRRKDGGYYWVQADTTPLFENGEITGYMSVRRPANEQEKSGAIEAYELIAEGKLSLHEGNPVTLVNRYNPLAHINPIVTLVPTVLLALGGQAMELADLGESAVLDAMIFIMSIISAIHVWYFINRVNNALDAVTDISSGQLTNHINVQGSNAAGNLNKRIKSMQIRLNAQQNEMKYASRRSTRLETGLNKIHTDVMVVDQNGTVAYFNEALAEVFRNVQEKIRKDVPDFNVDELLGKNAICVFREYPHVLKALSHLDEPAEFKIHFYGNDLLLSATPITSKNGAYLGAVVEWKDIFQEMMVQDGIKTLVEDARNGRLHSRMNTNQLDGFYLELATDINHLMDDLQSALRDISVLIGAISTKDLTVKTENVHQGQFGWTVKSLINGVEQLRSSFCKVNNQAAEVTQSANHVSHSNQRLANSIRSQSDELHKTSLTMTDFTTKINETADQAKLSNELVISTQRNVEVGSQSMSEAVSAMQEIQEVSEQITNIVTLIDGIAFQTNLLALNAAVEAARAGEHGRGFAVVAGEVRSLAGKSADAAKEISTLVQNTIEKVEVGTQKVSATGDALNEIIEQVDTVAENVSKITENTSAQLIQIDDVNTSIVALDKASSENSTLILENSSLADYLGDVAHHMDELVGTFELGDCEKVLEDHCPQCRGSLVLVVDDNISNQKVAVMILQSMGYDTKVASTGQDAINQCERYKPNLVLMDVEMPGMDGIEATKRLRANGFKAPIVAYTGHEEEGFEKVVRDAGMDGLLRKPVKPDEMAGSMKMHGCHADKNSAKALQVSREKIIEKSEAAKHYKTMIDAHLGWKKKIRQFIDGQDIGVTEESAMDYKACALGKWMYSDGLAMANTQLYKELEIEHTTMHMLIGRVMQAFKIDDYETMEQAVLDIDIQSEKVVGYLNQLIDMEG